MMVTAVHVPKDIKADPAKEAEEFLYIVTHDLKAFARAMREIPTWILEDIEAEGGVLPQEAQANFTMLQSYAHRMDTTLNALTALSRVGRISDEPADHDLLDLIHSGIAALPQTPRLHVDIDAQPMSVFGPANDLRSLFKQVLTNVGVHHDGDDAKVMISAVAKAGRAHIAICDDGPGIPPGQRTEMLKPLTTLKPKSDTGHAGVGLAIAQKIVRLAGGSIQIEQGLDPDASGRGCLVTFDLPLSAD